MNMVPTSTGTSNQHSALSIQPRPHNFTRLTPWALFLRPLRGFERPDLFD